jgi:hypothetical protein
LPDHESGLLPWSIQTQKAFAGSAFVRHHRHLPLRRLARERGDPLPSIAVADAVLRVTQPGGVRKSSMTCQPADSSRRLTRFVSAGDGISSVILLMATRMSVASIGLSPRRTSSKTTLTISSSDNLRRGIRVN